MTFTAQEIEELRAKYRIEYFVRDGSWYYRTSDGHEHFCANRCCKCIMTTDSQNDRFCDECWMIAPWYEKHKPFQLILAAYGALMFIKAIAEFF